MEAVMIAGLAAVIAGGYFSAVDLLNDLGFTRKADSRSKVVAVTHSRGGIAMQNRIKKMAGMNI